MSKHNIQLNVNGQDYRLDIQSNWSLLDVLRYQLHLTGTKRGCETGACGACTVILDGEAVDSCLVLAAECDRKHVTTIEGILQNGEAHPLQKAFHENFAFQCGFCAPGMIMATKALLDENPNPTDDEIKTAISGNLCRCTGYVKIIKAIKSLRINHAVIRDRRMK